MLKNTVGSTSLEMIQRTDIDKEIGNAPENEINNRTPNTGNQKIVDKAGFLIGFHDHNVLTTNQNRSTVIGNIIVERVENYR